MKRMLPLSTRARRSFFRIFRFFAFPAIGDIDSIDYVQRDR